MGRRLMDSVIAQCRKDGIAEAWVGTDLEYVQFEFDLAGHTASYYSLGVLLILFLLARRIVHSPSRQRANRSYYCAMNAALCRSRSRSSRSLSSAPTRKRHGSAGTAVREFTKSRSPTAFAKNSAAVLPFGTSPAQDA